MLRFVIGSVAFAGLLVGCGQSRCAPGEVPNDALQGCVVPKICDAGLVVNDRNECVLEQGSTEQPDGSIDSDGEPQSVAGRNGLSGSSAGHSGSDEAVPPAAANPNPDAGSGPSAPPSSSPGMKNDGAMPAEPRCGNGVREGGELCDGMDCPSSCNVSNACLVARLTGSATACDATCGPATEITECKSGDGCCAKGCTYATDTDCSKSCGDGSIDAPELCEPTSKEKPCPTSCDDHDPCTQDVRTGTAEQCSAACVYMKITSPRAGDGCCPDGATANNDSDCKPICGNGVVEQGEKCDGASCQRSCDDGDPCTRDTPVGSASRCDATCSNTPITSAQSGDGCCPTGAHANNDNDCKPVCGNGILESGEDCEGTSCATACDDGDPCTTDRTIQGANKCQIQCENTSSITEEQCDGKDNDCDGIVDNNVGEYWFRDCDGDGYAPQSTGTRFCEEPAPMGGCKWTARAPQTEDSTDCDDDVATRHPGAGFGLPIESAGAGLPPARDWAYDANCDGTQEVSDTVVLQGSLTVLQWCSSATQDCSAGNCINSVTQLGDIVCGAPYPVGTACGGDQMVYHLCR